MIASASVHTSLMERTVCRDCGHFHRAAIAGKCECCRADVTGGARS